MTLSRFLIFAVNLLISTLTLDAQAAASLLPVSYFKLSPKFDVEKDNSRRDYSGWAVAEKKSGDKLLIGKYDAEWLSAYNIKTQRIEWWFQQKNKLSVASLVQAQEIYLAYENTKLFKLSTENGEMLWDISLDGFVTRPVLLLQNTLL